METPDFGKALSLFSASRDEFDMWFKRRPAESTGLDVNNPPAVVGVCRAAAGDRVPCVGWDGIDG